MEILKEMEKHLEESPPELVCRKDDGLGLRNFQVEKLGI